MRLKWIKENRDRWLTYKKRHNSKRKGLGFFQLNNYFSGAVAHHINKEVVVYIPEEMHLSVKHNLETGKNMEKINKLALDFLEKKK